LYAGWEAIQTVTLQCGWNRRDEWVAIPGGFDITVPRGHLVSDLRIPVLEGFRFINWGTFAGEPWDSVWDEITFTQITEDITLYAGWEALPPMHTVTLVCTVRTGEVLDLEGFEGFVSNGDTIPLPPTPVLEGYHFEGWFFSVFPATVRPFSTAVQIFGEVTLYAVWTELVTITLYCFERPGPGGVGNHVIRTVPHPSGHEFIPPPVTRAGFTFDRWIVLPSQDTYVPAPIAGDAALYAVWR
jgi:hypothetical protein